MMNTVMDEWMKYAKMHIPPDATLSQYEQNCHAFYSGVLTALKGLLELGDESVTEEESTTTIDLWMNECEEYLVPDADSFAQAKLS